MVRPQVWQGFSFVMTSCESEDRGQWFEVTEEFRSRVVRMAWEDRTTFEEIERRTGLVEAEVIKVMRRSLKPGSFRLWRKRVSGRTTKHGKVFRHGRRELKRQPGRRWLEMDQD